MGEGVSSKKELDNMQITIRDIKFLNGQLEHGFPIKLVVEKELLMNDFYVSTNTIVLFPRVSWKISKATVTRN